MKQPDEERRKNRPRLAAIEQLRDPTSLGIDPWTGREVDALTNRRRARRLPAV